MTAAVPGITTVTTPSTKLQVADSILDQLTARITTPDEIPFLKVLIYCRTGVGKTWFSASAPSPCIYDVDGTTVSLQKHPEYCKIPVIPMLNEYQAEMVLLKVAEEKLWPDRQSFVFDSATVFQNKSLRSQIRTQLGIRDETATNSMIQRYLGTNIDWPANTQYMEDIVGRLSKITNKHVIVTAHVKMDKDNSSGVDKWMMRPDITNKAYQSFARWANVIGYLEVVGDKRTLRIKPSNTIDAKSHIGGPDVIENPTFQDLLAIKEKKVA